MKVILREAQGVSDAVLVMSWRNNLMVWRGLYTQSRENRPLTWEEHWRWWTSDYRKTWRIFIIQVNDGETTRDVGYLNVGQCDSWRPELGIAIGEVSLWGQGIAKQALILGLEWLKEYGYKGVHTTVLKGNSRALKLFESVGFKIVGDAREGEWWVARPID